MTNEDQRIGERIRELRAAAGLTQTELAERMTELGVPMLQQTVLKIEKGARALKLAEATAVASALRTFVSQLVPPENEALQISQIMSIARAVRDDGYKGSELLLRAEATSELLAEQIDLLDESTRRLVPDYALESADMTADEIFRRHGSFIRSEQEKNG